MTDESVEKLSRPNRNKVMVQLCRKRDDTKEHVEPYIRLASDIWNK